LQPEIGAFAYDDFIRAPELIRAGEEAARAIIPSIREWYPAVPEPQVSTAAVDAAMLPAQSWPTATEPAPAKS
ncbi:MAG TPA: hypothetical protein VE133_12460, partial [Candidatus Sulfotelmatobacter sp.]|nr:hypothetical protein [Candidatus Sulfotelmatobacter sp.]